MLAMADGAEPSSGSLSRRYAPPTSGERHQGRRGVSRQLQQWDMASTPTNSRITSEIERAHPTVDDPFDGRRLWTGLALSPNPSSGWIVGRVARLAHTTRRRPRATQPRPSFASERPRELAHVYNLNRPPSALGRGSAPTEFVEGRPSDKGENLT